MKTHALKFIPLALALFAAAPVFTGCTATATRESTGEFVDDSLITTKVKAALAGDKVVNAFAVQVETFKGVVQLSGFVDSAEQKQQAETVTARIKGVKSVVNHITVKAEAASTTR